MHFRIDLLALHPCHVLAPHHLFHHEPERGLVGNEGGASQEDQETVGRGEETRGHQGKRSVKKVFIYKFGVYALLFIHSMLLLYIL